MKQLELRFYSRQEIAETTGRSINSSHFARDVKSDLTKWGYDYTYNRNGVLINKAPETAKEKLVELMLRRFDLDVQVDVKAFGCFFFLLLTDKSFDCMPWAERAKTIWDTFQISICEKTLRNWTAALIKGEHIYKSTDDRIYWRTAKLNGLSIRESIDAETDADYISYKERQHQLFEEFSNSNRAKGDIWKDVYSSLWSEFGCCYYACPRFILNGISDEIDEIEKLVTEICLNE